MDNFLDLLFRDHAGQIVYVVTHGGTLRSFRFLLEGWDYERALAWPAGEVPRNCGVTEYAFDPATGAAALRGYNAVHWS